jgi:redox-sensitive bicupin YhaK (pirin superfamily)
MSLHEATEPACETRDDDVALMIGSKPKDLGGFSVRRVLPSPQRSAVGPFVFFDEMGPADFGPGEGIEVRPHPHIGLATLTYLFEGEIMHRDSLGFSQPIRPGAVNLMTAGRGIVHSERTAPELRESGQRLHGIQTWMALPDALAETDPAFVHHPADTMPVFEENGVRITIVAGEAFGARSPVQTASETLYLDLDMEPRSTTGLPRAPERAVYVAQGRARIGACEIEAGTMAVLAPGAAVLLHAVEASRVIVIGGAPVGERTLWWNFVSADPARIEQARDDWREGRFPMVAGDDEFIPLPEIRKS